MESRLVFKYVLAEVLGNFSLSYMELDGEGKGYDKWYVLIMSYMDSYGNARCDKWDALTAFGLQCKD